MEHRIFSGVETDIDKLIENLLKKAFNWTKKNKKKIVTLSHAYAVQSYPSRDPNSVPRIYYHASVVIVYESCD